MGTALLLQGQSSLGVKLTTHLHLVLRLRMRGAVPLHPYMPSWHAQRNLEYYFTLFQDVAMAFA